MIKKAIVDLNIKSNNLLVNFSFSNFSTLSVLFKSYVSTLWRYNNLLILTIFVFHRGKLLGDYGRSPTELITALFI